MAKRKLIGVIVAGPENTYQQRIFDGLFSQCQAYDYDLAVFSPLVSVYHFDQTYLRGELNIFELINFDLLDAVIVVPISLNEDKVTTVEGYIARKLAEQCRKPVVSLDMPINDYDTVYTDDTSAFYHITKHVVTVHGCKDIYFLNGLIDSVVSQHRLDGFSKCMKEYGLHCDSANVFYGDFWYSGGEQLADRMISGEIPVPQAVVCASDHMAIGLTNRLIKNGIDVPGQVVVTGYEATQEALTNHISVTSYIPGVNLMAAEAVNRIRRIIEPGKPILECMEPDESGMSIGGTCGCQEDISYLKDRLSSSFYNVKINYSDRSVFDIQDMGRLMDSYMLETLTASQDPADCLRRINDATYLIRPYDHLYMCLREDWLDTEKSFVHGYPSVMRSVIHAMPDNAEDYDISERYCDDIPERSFESSLMLPQMIEEHKSACVYYFAPIHFKDNMLGYTVLQCRLERKIKISNVFHTWMRNVNNALEMTRVQNRLMRFSVRDDMTGLYNRRGMEQELEKLNASVTGGEYRFAAVVDMDGLKRINDTYGHSEGDYGIKAVAAAVSACALKNELCVRAGGDEFYMIGLGSYDKDSAQERVKAFEAAISAENISAAKPYEITASIGCSITPAAGSVFEDVIKAADYKMYRYKAARKKQRR